MTQTIIAPGLTLTDDHFAAAAAGLAEHMPELPPLTPERFFSTDWTLIPDEQTGEPYKAELVLVGTRTRRVIVNRWLAPDLRDGKGPRPHNHPWDFHSVILSGGYTERRWTRRDGVVVAEDAVEYHAGEVNKIGREYFHEVEEVDDALTLMACGPGMAGWGYLDPDTGEYTPSELPEGFMDRLRELNPHQS